MAASSNLGLLPVPFIGQIVFDTRQKIATELSPFRIGCFQMLLFQKLCKKPLSVIEGGIGIITSTPDVGIDRRPIKLAQAFERHPSARMLRFGCLQHDAPSSRLKRRSSVPAR